MVLLTEKEYMKEIREIAEKIKEAEKAELEAFDLHEKLYELIDSHEWVIYYHRARQVAVLSDNCDEIFDVEGDKIDNSDGMFDCRRAYYAMCADVQRVLGVL